MRLSAGDVRETSSHLLESTRQLSFHSKGLHKEPFRMAQDPRALLQKVPYSLSQSAPHKSPNSFCRQTKQRKALAEASVYSAVKRKNMKTQQTYTLKLRMLFEYRSKVHFPSNLKGLLPALSHFIPHQPRSNHRCRLLNLGIRQRSWLSL